MEESVRRHHESAKYKVKKFSAALDFLAVIILIVSLFSLPFPFVRQIWLQSVMGALGFVNCGLILWLSSRIRQLSYPAAVGGLGLVFHEQLLAMRGFLTLRYHHAVDQHDVLFLTGTFVLTGVLAVIFINCLKPLEDYSKTFARDFYVENRELVSEKTGSFQRNALIESVIVYAILILALWQSRMLDLKLHFSVCKLVGELTCINAFYGVGRELDIYFKEVQRKNMAIIKIFSHLFVMSGVLWIIYRIMPIEPFLR